MASGSNSDRWALGIAFSGASNFTTSMNNGSVELGGVTLALSLLNGYLPDVGDAFYLLVNDDTEPIAGQLGWAPALGATVLEA